MFGSERLTGALLGRLTRPVEILEMNGDSYHLKQSKAGGGERPAARAMTPSRTRPRLLPSIPDTGEIADDADTARMKEALEQEGPLEGPFLLQRPSPSLAYFYSAIAAWNDSAVDTQAKLRKLCRLGGRQSMPESVLAAAALAIERPGPRTL